jgi:hypothetical protein
MEGAVRLHGMIAIPGLELSLIIHCILWFVDGFENLSKLMSNICMHVRGYIQYGCFHIINSPFFVFLSSTHQYARPGCADNNNRGTIRPLHYQAGCWRSTHIPMEDLRNVDF